MTRGKIYWDLLSFEPFYIVSLASTTLFHLPMRRDVRDAPVRNIIAIFRDTHIFFAARKNRVASRPRKIPDLPASLQPQDELTYFKVDQRKFLCDRTNFVGNHDFHIGVCF